MTRVYDAELVAIASTHFLKCEDRIDPVDWIADPSNIVLTNDRGDLALFEKGLKGVDTYTGHYYFQSRGRQAIEAAREFLDELFNTCYNVQVLMGLTPLTQLGARWLSRRVGFKSYGVERIGDKPYEVFIITKKEFNG